MMPGGGDKKEVKAKSLKALEKLGHKNLTLDEYESTSGISLSPFIIFTCCIRADSF